MAKVKITGHASGSGVFTITAPNSNTDRTITLPDASVTLGTDATKLPLAGGALTGNVTLTTANSPILKIEETGGSYLQLTAGGSTGYVDSKTGHDISFRPAGTTQLVLTSGGRGVSQFTAKAWINFNGQNTVAIRDSHNVSSITDNGTGNYNVTMANAMANVNYCVTAVSGRGGGEDMHALVPQSNFNFTTTQFRILTLQAWDTAHDASYVGATVFGD